LNTIHIGSCGWNYQDWRGSFYPTDLPRERWLAWYARVFHAVEIDSTFFGSPSAGTVARWLSAAPAHFRFTCKAPRLITHGLRLRGCEQAMESFLETMHPLRGRLGAVLVQLPRSFAPERDGAALRDFVRGLPGGWRFAVEFQHPEWHQPRFAKLLEDHGVCWAWTDTTTLREQFQGPFGFLPETADFLYLRLVGDWRTRCGADGKPKHHYRERLWSRSSAIADWALRLRKQDAKNLYVMCGNHFEGYAPATCRDLGAHLGQAFTLQAPAAQPLPGHPRQLQLL
jgi:uncharacterized protein YecE (DUF72 family)